MLGILYIMLNVLTGFAVCSLCLPKLSSFTRKTYFGTGIRLNPAALCFPLWYVTGAMLMTWCTYFTAYLASMCGSRKPLIIANAVVMLFFTVLDLLLITLSRRKKTLHRMKPYWSVFDGSSILFAAITFAFAALLMWWTFSYSDGELRVGISVFSDFAPHMGMIRSFSYGNNFPTTYSHFAGEDIKYHFLFQFMVGNLEFLGMRLDWAFNLPSAMCFAGAFCLLYVLAVKMTGRRLAGWFAGLLFAFRSSDAVFDYFAHPDEQIVAKTTRDKLPTALWKAFVENDKFIGTTTHEDWGLWNLNVYCNQRHLAIGLCVLLCVIILTLPLLFRQVQRIKFLIIDREEALIKEDPEFRLTALERAESAFSGSLLQKEGWLPRKYLRPIFLGVLLGMCSFFNGACVIGCLAVLLFLAVFSDNRLEYAITAGITVVMTVAATRFFIDGSVVKTKIQYGFLADLTTLAGSWEYIMTLCGILPLVLLAAFVISNNAQRSVWFAFTAPFILAFTLSLTKDVTVNHKYIMMSLMLLAVPAAYLLCKMWDLAGAWPKIICIGLLFVLTATGLYDFRTVLRRNDVDREGTYLVFRDDDPITNWVKDNATSQDIFLTPYYSLNNFVMGGAMLYYGWPYYAWSAGYDTDVRQVDVRLIYEAESPAVLVALVSELNIRYIVIDDDARSCNEYELNEDVIPITFEKVFEYGGTAIYDTTKRLESALYYEPHEDEPAIDY